MFQRTFSSAAAVLLACGAAQAGTHAGPVQQVVVASSPGTQQTTAQCSDGFVKITGAAVLITIPPGADQLALVRFNGNFSTSDSNLASVQLRIMAGARELNPVVSPRNDLADSRLPNGALLSIERSGLLAPGNHTVTVQWCVFSGDNFGLATVSGWHMSVEAAPVQ